MKDYEQEILKSAFRQHVDICWDAREYHEMARTEALYEKLTGEPLYEHKG